MDSKQKESNGLPQMIKSTQMRFFVGDDVAHTDRVHLLGQVNARANKTQNKG